MSPETAAVIAIFIGIILALISFGFLITLLYVSIKYKIEDQKVLRSELQKNSLTIWEIREKIKSRF